MGHDERDLHVHLDDPAVVEDAQGGEQEQGDAGEDDQQGRSRSKQEKNKNNILIIVLSYLRHFSILQMGNLISKFSKVT